MLALLGMSAAAVTGISSLIWLLVGGYIGYRIGSTKGLPVFGAVLGGFFPVVGLIVIALFPGKKPPLGPEMAEA